MGLAGVHLLCFAAVMLSTASAQDAPQDAPQELNGTLFQYAGGGMHVAFMTGSFPRHFILVGGLTNVFALNSFAQLLSTHLNAMKWSLVQPLLSSSGIGYGTSSLDRDAGELNQLAQHLKSFYNSQGIVMMGTSTGSQDTVRYVQRKFSVDPQAAPLLGAILATAVSDRQARAVLNDTAEWLARADAMLAAGQGDEILKRDFFANAPITAYRYHSLAGRGGDDDMFSSDFSDDELKRILGPLSGLPTEFLLAGNDGNVPSNVSIPALAQRFATAAGPTAKAVVLPGADHSLYGFDKEVVDDVTAFLARVNRTAAPARRSLRSVGL